MGGQRKPEVNISNYFACKLILTETQIVIKSDSDFSQTSKFAMSKSENFEMYNNKLFNLYFSHIN